MKKTSKKKRKNQIPKFKSEEANIFLELAIQVDKAIQDITLKQIKGKISMEDFLLERKKINKYTNSISKILISKISEIRRKQ